MLLLLACVAPGSQPKDSLGVPDSADSAPGETGETAVETGETAIETGDTADTGTPDETAETAETADTGEPPPVGPPRVILFIGDGMGFEHVASASLFQTGVRGGTTMETMPVQGRLRTASFSGITDSAAGATAMATGSKTFNGRLGLGRDAIAVENLVELARSMGLATGVVTTDELSGATPSAFLVHVEDRGDSEEIAAEQLASLPDLMLGGGQEIYSPLLEGVDATVVTTADELTAATPDGRPLIGVFADKTFPFVADGYDTQPTLQAMTAKAIDWLDDDPDGFFLMVEGARIDHASHSNRGDAVYLEADAFDQAIGTALGWAGAHPEANLLVTADHECGGLTEPETGTPGDEPAAVWRYRTHSNADVPVFGQGWATEPLDGQRVDNTWIHAALVGALTLTEPVEPSVPRLADGWTEDLGDVWSVQTQESSLDDAQLDGLRLTTDADGLWVGVDGAYTYDGAAVLLLVDLDYGAGTGFGADVDPTMADDETQSLISAVTLAGPPGFGADVALGSINALDLAMTSTEEATGVFGLAGEWGAPDAFVELSGVGLYDDGNVGDDVLAPDAGSTGTTEGGFEVWLPWSSLYAGGIPSAGASAAVAVVLLDPTGTDASNQALPPLTDAAPPGAGILSLASVLAFDIDGTGALTADPVVTP